MTHHSVDVAVAGQKLSTDAKGGRNFKVHQKGLKQEVKVLKEG